MQEEQGERSPPGPGQEAIDQSRELVRASRERHARSRARLARSGSALDRARNQLQAFVLRRALRSAGARGSASAEEQPPGAGRAGDTAPGPLRPLLVIVARSEPALLDLLDLDLASIAPSAAVLLDRRLEPRRRRWQEVEPERREAERRRLSLDDELREVGFAVVEPGPPATLVWQLAGPADDDRPDA